MTTQTHSKRNNWIFYGLVCSYFCISLGLNNGFILGGLTAFDAGFLETLDISVGQLKLRDSMTFIIVGIFALATGALVDKLGSIRVLIIGHCLFACAFWLLSTAKSIETIYAAQAILGLCQLCAGYVVCVIALSRYLPFKIGLAIGLMMAASSLANALLPALNISLIQQFGPSNTLAIIAASAIPLAIGAALIGRAAPRGETAEKTEDAIDDGPTLKEALQRPDFWAIVAIAVFSFSSFVGIVTNIGLFAANPPFSSLEAAGKFFLGLFAASLFAQVASGWIADKLPMRGIHMAGLGAMAIASFGLAFTQNASLAVPWFIVLGLGWGFNYVFIQFAVPARFAGKSLGKIFGAVLLAEAFAGAIGPFAFGASFDAFGSYTPALCVASAMLAAGVVAAAILHKPLDKQMQAQPA